jgi:hypothetical protein
MMTCLLALRVGRHVCSWNTYFILNSYFLLRDGAYAVGDFPGLGTLGVSSLKEGAGDGNVMMIMRKSKALSFFLNVSSCVMDW